MINFWFFLSAISWLLAGSSLNLSETVQAETLFFAKNIRHQYFILVNLPIDVTRGRQKPILPIYKNNKKVGTFTFVISEKSTAICRLTSGNTRELDENCYFSYGKQEKPHKIESESNNTSIANTKIDISGISFTQINHFYISPPFPFTRFNSIENINDFIDRLNKSSGNTYQFTIPTDAIILKNQSFFSPIIENDLFYICLFKDRLGYFYLKNGRLFFDSLSTLSLKSFADKFIIYIVSSLEK